MGPEWVYEETKALAGRELGGGKKLWSLYIIFGVGRGGKLGSLYFVCRS